MPNLNVDLRGDASAVSHLKAGEAHYRADLSGLKHLVDNLVVQRYVTDSSLSIRGVLRRVHLRRHQVDPGTDSAGPVPCTLGGQDPEADSQIAAALSKRPYPCCRLPLSRQRRSPESVPERSRDESSSGADVVSPGTHHTADLVLKRPGDTVATSRRSWAFICADRHRGQGSRISRPAARGVACTASLVPYEILAVPLYYQAS